VADNTRVINDNRMALSMVGDESASCNFGGGYTCLMTKATLVELNAGVATEEACRTLCCSMTACNHYSYFTSDSAAFSETCVLLSSCTGRKMDLSVRSGTSSCAGGAPGTQPHLAGVRTCKPATHLPVSRTTTCPACPTTQTTAFSASPSTATPTSPPVILQPACRGYHILDSVTRHVGTRYDAAVVSSACGDYCRDYKSSHSPSPDWRGAGWYRYQGEAGTRIPTSPPGYGQCGTYWPGWMEGDHPTVGEGEVTRTVYWQFSSSNTKWKSTTVKVANCGQFYVYHLTDTRRGASAYCGV